MQLYDIAQKMQNYLNRIDENGEIKDEELEELRNIELSYEEKALNIVYSIDTLKIVRDNLHDIMKRLKNRTRQIKKQIEKKEHLLLACMEMNNIKSIPPSAYFGSIFERNNKPKLEILNHQLLPEKYLIADVKMIPNEELITHDLENGILVPGAELVKTKSIVINKNRKNENIIEDYKLN